MKILDYALLVAAATMSLGAGGAAAQFTGARPDGWQYTLQPYLWLPNVNGTFKYSVPPGAGGRPEVEVGADDYLKNLDMALMLTGEARKGDWAIFTDIIYLDFSGEQGAVKNVSGPGGIVQIPVNAGTQTSLKGLVWGVAASYTAKRTDDAVVEVLGGFRYLELESSVNWQLTAALGLLPRSGAFSEKDELLDAIVGVRGRVKLGGGRWFMPYYLDAGAGSSDLTWQGLIGVGYSYRWGSVDLAYRHLSYDLKGDKFIQNVRFSGPVLGASFRF